VVGAFQAGRISRSGPPPASGMNGGCQVFKSVRSIQTSLAPLVVVAIGTLLFGCAAQDPGELLLLSGVVSDSTGEPVAGARVAIVAAPVEVPDIAALTSEDGRFSLGVPVAGNYRVAAFGDEGSADETVDIGPGSTAFVQLVLHP
jgi:hypothetical protein